PPGDGTNHRGPTPCRASSPWHSTSSPSDCSVPTMPDQAAKATRFLELHQPGNPLLMPNAWDSGSARVLASMGFQAIATTSGGHAATLGLLDGSVTRDQALEHAAQLAGAVDLP